jgi:hypothetical protein
MALEKEILQLQEEKLLKHDATKVEKELASNPST